MEKKSDVLNWIDVRCPGKVFFCQFGSFLSAGGVDTLARVIGFNRCLVWTFCSEGKRSFL